MENKNKKHNKNMKKTILIGLMIGIFIIGIIGAVAFNIIDEDFTKEIKKISITGICEAEQLFLGDYKTKKCKDKEEDDEQGEDEDKYDIEINQSIISILENPDTGLIRISAD